MTDVERAVRDGLVDGRKAVRTESRQALAAEWVLVQKRVAQAGYAKPDAPLSNGRDRTDIRAASAAKSYAAAWGSTAIGKAEQWTRDTASKVTDAVAARLDRIIATETSDAFQEERASFEAEVVQRHSEEKWFPLLLKVWDARLDGGRCGICTSRSLTVRPWGIDFAGGDAPGKAHPNCRCVAVSIMLPIPYQSDIDEAA